MGSSSYQPFTITTCAIEPSAELKEYPALLFSTAESLALPMHARIEQAFGCPVMEGYAASEAAAIAFECRQKRLHVNADWVILEPVDETYQPVPPGQPSHTVLVTNLANRVQPIIRYDLGDSLAVVPEPYSCGSPLPVIRWRDERTRSSPSAG